MSVKRNVIIPAILTLSTAGSILAGSAATVLATSAPSAVAVSATTMKPAFVYHG
jgi:hypothetical protein